MTVSPTDLAFAGAADQMRLMDGGLVSAREVIEATLAQIEETNPRLNAFRVVFAEAALASADHADALRSGGERRPLLGVPVAIKDDVDVAGEVTAWGTDAFGPPKSLDSDVITRLRAAGAIIVGKTHVPEMTLWPWTVSSTWGTTRNPWDSLRSPGGSSGGSAVAASMGMCGVALGSDGGGSIRYPSALTGLFGIKPQRDRIPLGPDHRDAWNGLTAYGPLARTVRDAALFLDATADRLPLSGFGGALDEPLRRLRIAVSFEPPFGSFAHLADDRREGLERTAELLRTLGHHVFEQELDYGVGVMSNVSVRYIKGAQHDITTMERPQRLEVASRRLAAVGRRIPDSLLRRARRSEAAIGERMNRIFDRADVVMTPIAGGPPTFLADIASHGLLRSLLHSNVTAWAAPWNSIGQPAASVPVGFDTSGLPLAVQLCGRTDDEATLLCLAAQMEAASPWTQRRPPGATRAA